MRNRLLGSVLTLMMVGAFAAAVGAQGGPPAGGAPGAQGGRPGGGGGGRGGGRGGGGGFSLPPLLMETDAYPDGGIVPPKYVSANNGGNTLPGFKVSNAPAGTVSYAVIFHDMDVQLGGPTDVLHMIAWNIPASANGWPEGKLPEGSVYGQNTMRNAGYTGPGAPAGPRYHHYVFELYALNSNLDLPATATRDDLLKAMTGKTVAKAAYVGRYRSGEAPAPAPAGRQ